MSGYLDPVGEGRQIVLDKAVVFVGRAADCDVVLTRSRKISRKHCCIAQVGNRYIVRDLGSLNGVRINGARVKNEARLKFGDELAIGDVLYVLRSVTDPPDKSNGKSGKAASRKVVPAKSPQKPSPPQPATASPAPPMPSEEFAVILPEADEEAPEFPQLPKAEESSQAPEPDGDWLLESDTP
jgi:pSer/pThr/pTyr-binding forkhead associated (FHA) protein